MSTLSGKPDPVVRAVTTTDIVEAFAGGLRDFQAEPMIGLLFGGLYALGGIALVLIISALGLVYLAYPLASGFAMLAPFVAIAFYEVSRRREAGERASLSGIWRLMTSRAEIGWMAFVTLFIFIVWMYQARFLMALFFGLKASFTTIEQFTTTVFSTNEGLLFLVIGNLSGAALSLVLFSLTVVSFPLLLERDVDVVTAMITSVRAVTMSPGPMLGWAAVIGLLLTLSALPFFLGLIVTLPVLGHATWHLYRRIVAPEIGQPV